MSCLSQVTICGIVHHNRLDDFVRHATHGRCEEKDVVWTDVVKVKVETHYEKYSEARRYVLMYVEAKTEIKEAGVEPNRAKLSFKDHVSLGHVHFAYIYLDMYV